MSTNITHTKQFLSVYLDKAIYAFDIQKVKEIIDVIHITRVPRMPDYMLGAINLRGEVVPVLDLRERFGLPKGEQTVDTGIIIVETSQFGHGSKLGLLVDAISQVLTLDTKRIEASPRTGMNIPTDFIKGVGQKQDEFIVILDIDRLLGDGAIVS